MEGESFTQDFLPVSVGDEQTEDGNDQRLNTEQSKGPFREQDIYLPIANVARIMKNGVPANGKIAKDAKECVQECVSEFISFITSEASERCTQEKRKTINGEDVLFAMATLGFDPYIEPLKIYLQKYRDCCMNGDMYPYTLKSRIDSSSLVVQESERVQVLKAEKGGARMFLEGQDSTSGDADLLDPFGGEQQYADMLVTSHSSGVDSSYSSQL